MRRWILLLVLVAGSCAPTPEGAAAAYDRAVTDLERGDLQQARDLVRRGSDAWRAQARSPWYWRFRLLDAEILIAQGNAAEALRLVEAPVSVDEDILPLEARRQKIRAHACLNLGRYDEAKNFLNDAAQRAAVAALPRLALEIEVLHGLLLIRTSDVPAGEAATRAALQHAVDQRDSYWQAAALNNLGLSRIYAFQYDEAIPFLEQALKAAGAVRAQRFAAASLANLGACYYRIGDFDKALSFLERAVSVQEQIGALAGLQSSLGDIGNTLFIQGHPERAVDFYRRALALARSSAPWDRAKWAGNLATAHADLEQWDDAERFNRESLSLRETGDAYSLAYAKLDAAAIAAGRRKHEEAIVLYEETLALARDNAELTWEANAGLGASYAALGAPEKASLVFERCLQTIDAARRALSTSDYKLTFLSRLIRFHQLYVDLLVTSADSEKALKVADSSRARLLSERLEIGQDRRADVNRASLQQAAKRLNVVLLSYWVAPNRSFLWVITGDAFHLIELPGRDRIAELVEAYRGFIETSLRDPIAAEFPAARALYDILLAPARAFIPPGSHVVIVPDGPLHALNFETLPVFSAKPHYWIEDVTVSIAPALALIAAMPPPRSPATTALLLLGDPEPAGPDFPRLADAGREIDAIHSRFASSDTTVLTGSRASPAAYEQSKPERFSMIHFAAHATANRASPLDSAVILSPDADGFMLTARDVLNRPLRADLVTISACRSAGATVYGGEGIVGFVWAFLQAGARNVIAGLWDASDRSTSQLMSTLYEGLHAGASPPDALRAAKLALVHSGSNFASPYYWGPFQVYVGGVPPRALTDKS